MSSLNVQSNPAGVDVFVDGVAHGRTPARVSRPARISNCAGGECSRHSILRTANAGCRILGWRGACHRPARQSDPPGAKFSSRHRARCSAVDDSRSRLAITRSNCRATAPAPAPLTCRPVGPRRWSFRSVERPPPRIRIGISQGALHDGDPRAGTAIARPTPTVSCSPLVGTTGSRERSLGYRATRVVQVGPGKVAGFRSICRWAFST
jgi:hypothetical protein